MTLFLDIMPALEEAEFLAIKHKCRYAVVSTMGGYRVVAASKAAPSRVVEICRP